MDTDTDLGLRQLGKAETRNTLLNVALNLFAEKGFEKTRASEIAKKAGVAVGTIYLNFGDKEGLLREILVHVANEIDARVGEVYARTSPDPEELARRHIETFIQFIEEDRKHASFVLGYALSHHPVGARILDYMFSQVEEDIRRGQEKGIYRKDIDPAVAARAEGNMNLGVLSWWIKNPALASRETIIDTLTKFRLSGLHVSSK